jgi:carotenoid 1,2-hydratase
MIGSVFSPYYRKAIERGAGDPSRHAAVNLAHYDLHRPGGIFALPSLGLRDGERWVLTEGGALSRGPSRLSIGETCATWQDGVLRVSLRDVTSPLPSRVAGELTLRPASVGDEVFAIDGAGRHVWSPIAPFGRIEVALREPRLSWRGAAYLDFNAGEEPLARAFRSWTWSRVTTADRTVVVYDTTCRDGRSLRLARSFHAAGAREPRPGEARAVRLGRTRWRIDRQVRAIGDASLALGRTLEDTPFYARSHLVGTLDGRPASGVHEVVDLDRFESPVVQRMLPYRMRRAT